MPSRVIPFVLHLAAAVLVAVFFVISNVNNKIKMKPNIKLTIFLLSWVTQSFAAEIRGRVTDYFNGEALENVSVEFVSLKKIIHTDNDGEFVYNNLSDGRYVIQFSLEKFHTYTTEVTVSNNSEVALNIELKPTQPNENSEEFVTSEPKYILEDVIVTTTRASRDHPVTYTNMAQDELEERNYGQDLPLLFSEMPNLNAYSDGGNGIGYSYLRMRGFSQNRVAVQVNGVPLNDAESHEVFWVDLPDFANDLQDIQVQRGIGSSLYGPAALGGSINLITQTPGLTDRAMLRAEGSYGSWNTRRVSVEFRSGRIQKRYGISARLTRMASEGYRENSWARLWSYNISAARYSIGRLTKLCFYGGPERLHLAYEGIPMDSLSTNRRYNPLTYEGEVDNFFQPHYELHDEWMLTGRLQLLNTIYMFRGDGYYDQWRPSTDVNKIFYHLADDTTTFDLLRHRNISETDWGWIPRLVYAHKFVKTTLGGEMRIHSAHHEGNVMWGNPLPANTTPNYKYYDYRVGKNSFSGYIHNLFYLNTRLTAMADIQAQSHTYKMDSDKLFGVSLERSFDSFNPRIGLSYLLKRHLSTINRPQILVYTNFSWAQREPAFSDIYDPQDYYSLPISAPNRFVANGNGYTYIGSSLKPEKLLNLEFGSNFQWKNAHAGVNIYHMALRDEIIPYAGQLDDNGVPVSGNAERTLHQGIEFVGAYSPIDYLNFSGNLSLTDHYFQRYKEWDWGVYDFVDRNGNRLAQDAPYLANLRAEFRKSSLTLAISMRAIGKQYLDNSENSSTAVPAYSLFNADATYRFEKFSSDLKALEFKVRVNNLFDKEYESFGYNDWDDGTPRYMVGAPRAVYTTLAVEL